MNLTKVNFPSFIYPLLAGIFGGIFFFFFYSEIFSPGEIGWITTAGWDTFQHYVGWEMFRISSWSFPVGIIHFLAYPVGVPVIYTDPIPLVAIPLKLFRSILPATFQYLGIWTCLSFVLQGVTGFYLGKLFLKKNILALIGSLFFIASPIIMLWIGGHAVLGSHWLILWALYLLLRPNKLLSYYQWTAVLLVSLLIHPYLFFMIGIIMATDLVRLLFVEKSVSLFKIILFLFSQIILVLLTAYVTGMFYIGNVAAVGGFGIFTANLNSFFNPAWGDWSRILPNLPTARYQYEGFSYLGVGIISLLFLGLIKLFISGAYNNYKIFFKQYWPVVVMSLCLFIFALGNNIFWGEHLLFSFSLPAKLESFLDILRGSGRFIWPVYYLLFLLALLAVRTFKTKIAVVILLVAVGIQFYDISGHMAWEQTKYENKVFVSNLVDPIWFEFSQRYDHISLIPHSKLDLPALTSISVWAIQNKKTLNESFSAREIKGAGEHIAQEIGRIKQGEFEDKTLYIFTENADLYTQNLGQDDWLGVVDGYTVMAPGFQKNKNRDYDE